MHDFEYVKREEYQLVKNDIIDIILEVQDEVREHFTFQYHFIGSTDRKMITRDRKSNIGYDFDVNLEVHYDDDNYNEYDLRKILYRAIQSVSRKYGYNHCEDSTRVITIKQTNPWRSSINHSCDFAIVSGDYYIRFYKEHQSYGWARQSKGYIGLEKKADKLKDNGYWNEVRAVYIDKKNRNDDPDKHSRSIYAETINEVYTRYLNDHK